MVDNQDILPESDTEKKIEELDTQAGPETREGSALEVEVAHLKDQWMRAVAETENLRRRAQREREEALKYAGAHFARDMVLVADNLRRALENCPPPEELSEPLKALIQGVEMTENSLASTFDRHGIKKIDPLQEKFDANFHQAMFEVEDATVSPGTIVQVLQAGYIMHDRLLRPAMVGVSK